MIKKILLFKLGAIGDTLMTTPLIRQLRKNFPKAKIDYLIGKTASQVLYGNIYLDNIIKFDEQIFIKKKFFKWLKLIKKIRKRKYDLIFVLDKHWIFNLTAKLFGISRRVGFDRLGNEGIFLTDRVYYSPIRHEIFYYLDLLKIFIGKADYKDWQMDLFLNKKDLTFANKIWKEYKLEGKKVIGIAPGGGNPFDKYSYLRILPINYYADLIKKLIKKNYIILFGGKNDFYIGEKLEKDIKSRRLINLIGKTTLKQTAALMAKCNNIYCNDSGAMHIAASVNKKINSFFIVTHPKRKAPLWKESKYSWISKNYYCWKCELFGKYGYYKDKDKEEI